MALARHEWHLSGASLDSAEVLLNGAPLGSGLDATGELPRLPPLVVNARDASVDGGADGGEPGGGSVGNRLVLAPRSVAFVVLPSARWAACLTGDAA